MIDRVFISIKSGDGGDGAISGRREKYVPRGGPDGGNGGDGGDIYLISDPNINTLFSFRNRRQYTAGDGGMGKGGLKHGKKGDDVSLSVPVGTQVWIQGKTDLLIADLDTAYERIRVTKGGRGGAGNRRYATSTNQFPLLAQTGEKGEEQSLRLELKLLADVGIIGAPNAGKSTLLAALTAARPKIADYPFTTIEPVLGVVDHRDESVVMVDIPGLIEGAHEGVGLGHDFLRHIERTKVLIHVVDGSLDDPAYQCRQTNRELELFNADLARKPQILAVNKADMVEVRERLALLENDFSEMLPVHFISAVAAEGLGSLVDAVLQELHLAPIPGRNQETVASVKDLPVLRPRPRAIGNRVHRNESGEFVVDSSDAIRIAERVDVRSWSARIQLYARLRRTGVVKALEDAGIMPGDTVRIGETELEWE